MHSGPLMVTRIYMLHAKPWQQLLICAVFVAVGAALMAFGEWTGVIPIVFGVFLALPIVSGWLYSARRCVRTNESRSRSQVSEDDRTT
jgi:hypothetical protein